MKGEKETIREETVSRIGTAPIMSQVKEPAVQLTNCQ
jgi:hypothetical protein